MVFYPIQLSRWKRLTTRQQHLGLLQRDKLHQKEWKNFLDNPNTIYVALFARVFYPIQLSRWKRRITREQHYWDALSVTNCIKRNGKIS
jgi:hypothetical protein